MPDLGKTFLNLLDVACWEEVEAGGGGGHPATTPDGGRMTALGMKVLFNHMLAMEADEITVLRFERFGIGP